MGPKIFIWNIGRRLLSALEKMVLFNIFFLILGSLLSQIENVLTFNDVGNYTLYYDIENNIFVSYSEEK